MFSYVQYHVRIPKDSVSVKILRRIKPKSESLFSVALVVQEYIGLQCSVGSEELEVKLKMFWTIWE